MASIELRAAAEQALEALHSVEWHGGSSAWMLDDCKVDDAINALRAALAEEALQRLTDVSQEIEAALAEPVQEPVAWAAVTENGKLYKAASTRESAERKAEQQEAKFGDTWRPLHVVPLYAAPPQRKPLTEEEIDSIWDSEKAFADIYAIARAIERAHGIDGAPEERHFCPRCGKRANGIHTCTPPAPLTDEIIADLWHQNGGFHHHFARAIERWLKGNP